MTVHSILYDMPPDLDMTPVWHPYLTGPRPFQVARVAYRAGKAQSALFVANDGEILLTAAPGISVETTTNPEHHHVTALTAQRGAYAAALGVDKFWMIYRNGKAHFVSQRFPEWTQRQTHGDTTVFDLEVPLA